MAESNSPFEANPPAARRLRYGIGGAVLVAALLLVIVVLPAEFGIDPTGIGRALGLTAINAPAGAPQIKDVIGGNQNVAAVKMPDVGDPIPLPNPAVSQLKPAAAKTQTQTVTLPAFKETEVKMLLDEAQVALYSWEADGDVYVDFHGHDPAMGKGFVRYEEKQETRAGNGSLVAPFKGEHGWFWLNLTDKTVTIKLTVSGYFNSIKDYGIFESGPPTEAP
jgi:hypothetical protein